jgi:glyoxylase-like metal-dependent hydrolase (beta-lactamase superfamily II)
MARISILLAAISATLCRPAAGQSFVMHEVADGVFAAIPRPGVPAGANAAFIINDDDVLVVDTHMRPSFARDLLAQIGTLTPLPVRWVVNTHWHPDHTQGNQAYTGVFPGEVIFIAQRATRVDIATLGLRRLAGDREQLPRQITALEERLPFLSGSDARRMRQQIAEQRDFLEELRLIELILPSITFERSLRLHTASRDIDILYFGKGHTRGDAVVYLPRERVAMTGDLVTGGPPFARDGYPSEWIETLSALLDLDIAVVVPGHGAVREGKQVIADRIDFLRDAMTAVTRGLVGGNNAEQIAAKIDLDAYRHTFDPEPPNHPWRDWMIMLAERAIAELAQRRD